MTQPSLYDGDKQAVPYQRRSRTSRQAAEAISSQPQVRGAKMRKLLALYVQAGAHGCTDGEIHAATKWERSSICSLRGGLMKRGLVTDGYTERKGTFKVDQTVYVVTSRGREAASA